MDDAATLQMALVGYQIEKQRIESRMREIQSQLKGKRAAVAGNGPQAAAGRRELSAAARARIAAAQKRRWAEYRKKAAKAAKAAKTSTAKVAAAS
jgi:hypothetical protein